MSSAAGPTPGFLLVSTTGQNVDLSQLTTPGLYRVMNLEDEGGPYVELGIHDGSSFHPLHEILPQETYPGRLSRNLGVEEDVPGTGTSAVVNALYLRAVGSSCKVLIEVFEK